MPAFVPFPEPRLMGTFLGRRKRFITDVRLASGEMTTAHSSNTGSMRGCLVPDAPVVLWDSQNPKRKLRYTWKAIQVDGTWIGIDTSLPNALVAKAIEAGDIPALGGFDSFRREVAMGSSSRVDIYLEGPTGACFVEVKNVTLTDGSVAMFPDAVTSRGLKHLVELGARVEEGHRAAMVYVVQRGDGTSFRPAREIDPAYAEGLATALCKGVEVYVLGTRVTPEGVTVTGLLPFDVGGSTPRRDP